MEDTNNNSVTSQEVDSIKESTSGSDQQAKPIATLLGSISYSNESDYDRFLNNLTVEHAIVILFAGVNYAQSKGVYSLDEAELLTKAIKRFKLKQQTQTNSDQSV